MQSGGLIRYNNYSNNSKNNVPQTILPKVEVGDILKDSRGNIWVSTLNNGVFILPRAGKQIQKFSYNQQLHTEDIWYLRYKDKNLDIGYNQLIVDQLKNGSFYKRWVGDTTINFNPVALFCSYKKKILIFGTRSIYKQALPQNLDLALQFHFKDHFFTRMVFI
ncbi:hypothetical protein [Niabella hibiscisoli]|uniref:hypothetical protein n=1 Tax=Niabella hibiscisoli TaxID=1825928 RepID=UPI001F0FA311|nr:hypothetical protein [Niabella hibiscisoli]MCH5718325.1 hypothetical protein [Niabella hibiscisoli]